MRIDVHTHFIPTRYFEEMERLGALQTVESFSVYAPLLGKSAEKNFANGEQAFVDSLIDEMDRSDVDLAVLSIGAVQPYFPDLQTAVRAVRYTNEMLAGAVEMGGGRLAAFASVPLPHGNAAADELRQCLGEPGFVGVNVGCSADSRPLDDPQFGDFWAAADELDTAVFLHPGSTPNMAVGSEDYHLAPDFCSPTEMAVALCRLVVNEVTSRHPSIDYIAGTMGGTLPYLARRFDRGLAQTHPDLHRRLGGVVNQLQKLWYDTSMIEDPYFLDTARNSIGVDRLMFGSDVPRGPLSEAVEFITESDRLSEDEKTMILDHNAMVALGMAHGHDPGSSPA